MQSLILNQQLNFRYNPFSGITDSELNHIVVPNLPIEKIRACIDAPHIRVIEIVGKKGRGKTTHLKWLQKEYPQFPIYLLSKKTDLGILENCQAAGCFVDSIHHLPLLKRLKLYQAKNKIILTSHYAKTWEYRLSKVTYKRFRMQGIQSELLVTIIKNRIARATGIGTQNIKLNLPVIQQLIHKYNDDFRGILNSLYQEFQSTAQ